METKQFTRDVCPQFFTMRRSLSIIAAASLFLSVIAIAVVLYFAKPIMLPLAGAFIISVMLAPLTGRLVKVGFSQQIAAGAVTACAFAAIISLLVFTGRPAMAWVERAPELVVEAREKLSGIEKAVTTMKEVSEKVEEMANVGADEGEAEVVSIKDREGAKGVTKAAPGAIIQFLFTWVLVFFFLSERNEFRRKLAAANPSVGAKLRAMRMFANIEQRIGSYMLTMAAINAFLGLSLAAALWAVGMPSPHVWGLLAAVLNFIPYIGPAILTVLLGLSGIVHYDDSLMALAPAGIFILLNFIESNFLTPMIMGVKMKITPIAIIVSVSLLTFLWGAVGGVLAIPLLLIFKAVCDATPALGPVGVLIGELERVDRGVRQGLASRAPARA
ncbi:AI-2E family transporter [Hyphococcus sp.]|uniref:AI-2E family transporter n=1 Tax=Hyphococcus sp. TaxID=2038636 RepID=UPI0035C6E920